MRYCLHENHYLITGKTSESVHEGFFSKLGYGNIFPSVYKKQQMCCTFIFIFICADCKRRLIDLWGHSQDWDYSKLTKQQLEKK